MKLMLMREFREGWRSFRFPGVLLGALFFALLAPPTQKYMDVILGMFAEGMEIVLPPVSPESVFMGFAGDMTSMILIAAIVVTMGIVARERHNGLSEWFLTRPVSRNAYLYAKVLYVIISTLVIVAAASLGCAIYTYTIIGPLSAAGVIYAIILLTTYMLLPLMLTVMVSAITGISGAAAGAGILLIFLMSSVGWILSNADISWMPTQLMEHLPQVLAGTPSSSFWISVTLSWIVIILLAWITSVNFARKQI